MENGNRFKKLTEDYKLDDEYISEDGRYDIKVKNQVYAACKIMKFQFQERGYFGNTEVTDTITIYTALFDEIHEIKLKPGMLMRFNDKETEKYRHMERSIKKKKKILMIIRKIERDKIHLNAILKDEESTWDKIRDFDSCAIRSLRDGKWVGYYDDDIANLRAKKKKNHTEKAMLELMDASEEDLLKKYVDI